MPIPPLNADGLLPPGVHPATADEIRQQFGGFQGNDQRPRQFVRLTELAAAMQRSGLFESLLIDGSFVTAKPNPNDIDLILVVATTRDFRRDLPPRRVQRPLGTTGQTTARNRSAGRT